MTEAELVSEVLAGRSEAFAELVERHHEACLRFARHLLGDRNDAEDAVQETFVRAYRGLTGYRERETFRAWLFQILINRCRTMGASRSRRHERFVRDETAMERAVANGETNRWELGSRLEAAMDGLDALHREAFLLKVGEELDYAEMARLTGASIPALKMRVKRAREHVQQRWVKEDA